MLESINAPFYLILVNAWNGEKTMISSYYVNYSYLNHGTKSMVVRNEGTVGRE